MREENDEYENHGTPKEDYDFEVSSIDWAAKVMELFWLEWFETYIKPEVTDEENKRKSKAMQYEFDNAQFGYGNSPVKNLQELRKLQSAGWECGLEITEHEVKQKFLECALPNTPMFNGVTLPAEVQPYFDFSKPENKRTEKRLTPVVVQRWWSLGKLDGEKPLNEGVNFSQLRTTCEMDPDEACMPDRYGILRPVPKYKRLSKWGYPEQERQSKKKGAKKKLAGDASERKATSTDASERKEVPKGEGGGC